MTCFSFRRECDERGEGIENGEDIGAGIVIHALGFYVCFVLWGVWCFAVWGCGGWRGGDGEGEGGGVEVMNEVGWWSLRVREGGYEALEGEKREKRGVLRLLIRIDRKMRGKNQRDISSIVADHRGTQQEHTL